MSSGSLFELLDDVSRDVAVAGELSGISMDLVNDEAYAGLPGVIARLNTRINSLQAKFKILTEEISAHEEEEQEVVLDDDEEFTEEEEEDFEDGEEDPE